MSQFAQRVLGNYQSSPLSYVNTCVIYRFQEFTSYSLCPLKTDACGTTEDMRYRRLFLLKRTAQNTNLPLLTILQVLDMIAGSKQDRALLRRDWIIHAGRDWLAHHATHRGNLAVMVIDMHLRAKKHVHRNQYPFLIAPGNHGAGSSQLVVGRGLQI